MHPIGLFTVFMPFTVLALASPLQATEAQHYVQLFKRGDPLTLEDLLTAEKHGVNTTEMFKHSIIKRRGEEDVTIWVDRSFTEVSPQPDPSLFERALHIKHPYNYYPGTHREQCREMTYYGDTGPNAPCTGGIAQIRDWAARTHGFFVFEEATTAWRTVLVAGTNSDCNGRFRVGRQRNGVTSRSPQMGNVDVNQIVHTSLRRYTQTHNGRDRVRAHGTTLCGEYQQPMKWQIRRWGERV